MATEAVLMADQKSKLIRREEVAEGTMAFHFEKPSGFAFKAGQSADVTLINPPDTDAEGNTRTFSIASPPFENELVFTTRMRDTAFKRSLKKVPLATEVKIGSAQVPSPYTRLGVRQVRKTRTHIVFRQRYSVVGYWDCRTASQYISQ